MENYLFNAKLIKKSGLKFCLLSPILEINQKSLDLNMYKEFTEGLIYLFNPNANLKNINYQKTMKPLEIKLSENINDRVFNYIKQTYNSNRELLNFLVKYRIYQILNKEGNY